MEQRRVLASYLRISLEDRDLKSGSQKAESNSISAQRQLIRGYIQSHPDLGAYRLREFLDDGYSGTTLNRPALQEMLALARNGRVHCVIMKDVSRFGRNYIEIGNYIEQVFPFLGVRFISVNDHFDSRETPGQTPGLDMAFKNILYDFYSKDLSKKVLSVKRMQQAEGKFVAAKPPFGYLISPDNRYQLIPDPQTAPWVRAMFEMTLEGKLPSEIASFLNEKKVPTPVQRNFREFGFRDRWYREETMENSRWTGSTVLKIIKDPTMSGCTVNNRVQVTSIGSRRFKRQAETDFVVVADTHTALVDPDTFQKTRAIIKARAPSHKKGRAGNETAFGGKIFCGECGNRLRRESRSKQPERASYYCPRARQTKNQSCAAKSIREDVLKSIVCSVLKAQFQLAADWNGAEFPQYRGKELSRRLKAWKGELNALRSGFPPLYEAYSAGQMSHEDFLRQKAARADRLRRLQSEIENGERLLSAASEDGISAFLEWLETVTESTCGRPLTDAFVEAIYLDSRKSLRIVLKGADPLDFARQP